jgi:hypothetical protein
MIATYGLRGHEVWHIHRLPGKVEADAGVIEVGSFPSQGDGSATKTGHRCIWPHQAKPVLAHKQPGEEGAVEEIKSVGLRPGSRGCRRRSRPRVGATSSAGQQGIPEGSEAARRAATTEELTTPEPSGARNEVPHGCSCEQPPSRACLRRACAAGSLLLPARQRQRRGPAAGAPVRRHHRSPCPGASPAAATGAW